MLLRFDRPPPVSRLRLTRRCHRLIDTGSVKSAQRRSNPRSGRRPEQHSRLGPVADAVDRFDSRREPPSGSTARAPRVSEALIHKARLWVPCRRDLSKFTYSEIQTAGYPRFRECYTNPARITDAPLGIACRHHDTFRASFERCAGGMGIACGGGHWVRHRPMLDRFSSDVVARANFA